jgi:hypothetical protein
MKLCELMIGDWVYVEKVGKPVRVESVGYTAFVGYEHFQEIEGSIIGIRPIELSKEIFEKNGYHFNGLYYTKSDWPDITTGLEDNEFEIGKAEIYGKGDIDFGFTICVKYVHELQHALKLCGIEKEIIL